ncbi:MAG: sugar transferase [Phycisphaerales bacterium]|nr:MAG: sugar transferase [Phycisphaerales bacterium]
MIAERDDRTVLIHFGKSVVEDALSRSCPDGDVEPLGSHNPTEWYYQWASKGVTSLFVLVPESLKDRTKQVGSWLKSMTPLWYADHTPLSVPRTRAKAPVWVVNGDQMPLIDWEGAAAAAQHESAEVVVFGPSEGVVSSHYPESVQVDDTGAVVRFTRHYSDSPAFAAPWEGPPSFLVTTGEHASAVIKHVLCYGWGLDSIGALTRRFSICWSADSAVGSRLYRMSSPEEPAQGVPDPPAPHKVIGLDNGTSGGLGVKKPDVEGEPSPAEDPSNSPGEEDEKTGATPDGEDSALIQTVPAQEDYGPATELIDASPTPPPDGIYLVLKRIMDSASAAVLLILLSPPLVVVALLIKVTSPGPVLFGHKRQGLGGKEFLCWKFRTMLHGADSMQDELRAINEVDGPQFKIADDPRIHKVGRWLRRYNIDELPQLINVLLGQMSLVGPRPSPDHENQLCPGWRRTRLSMRPGITGLWQVLRLRDTPEADFQEWIYYDVEYARHRSLLLDVQLLLHTPFAMFSPVQIQRFAEALERRGICVHSRRLSLKRADIAE